MMEDVALFEKAAKKSWQSFSTMRRFVDEATRLENASWRLWSTRRRREAPSCDDGETDDSMEGPRLRCVYCDLHSASLSCKGCCHDVYCVSCFKLIHKKGNLATHTAVKLEAPSVTGSSGASTSGEEGAEVSTTSGDVEIGLTQPRTSILNKPWELQMDMLLQRLMMNSINTDFDISVRNIDRRESLYLSDSEEEASALQVSVGNKSTPHPDHSNQAVVAAAVAAAGRHRAHSLTVEGHGNARSPVSSRDLRHTASEVWTLPTRRVSHPVPSRRKDSMTCANCSGNHITVACPLLEKTLLLPRTTTSSAPTPVDTVLRKCFTTIHNHNLSNSTLAFLGDEGSVRGGSTPSTTKLWPSVTLQPNEQRPASFGMNVISEDKSMAHDDTKPLLVPLVASSDQTCWTPESWFLSCLATHLPLDVFEHFRRRGRHEKQRSCGWAYFKVPGQKWCKRFLSLYRNTLWESLDATDTSRPVGFANLSDGSIHPLPRSPLEFVLKYNLQSSASSGRSEVWLKFLSSKDATAWHELLTRAVKLQLDDLFDLTPEFPGWDELGQGRFSVVRRARRKEEKGQFLGRASEDCALKIIDKNVFWDLVAHETEREDTIVREILTQTLLTVRAGASYCPVIRLHSLFETPTQLVLELELMRDGDLHEEIVTKSAVQEPRAAFLIASLVHAIDFCQRNGVAHRDVKLSNLALDYEASASGQEYAVIKVADFGMAAFVQSDGMLRGRCGTPGFVAPEILSAGKGEAYPCGVDMFSAGVVAYTMLCGYEPFFGVNDEELIQMNKRVDYEFEEPEWASISDEAKDMISLMMEKDPYKRITPKEVLKHPFLRAANAALEDLFKEQTQRLDSIAVIHNRCMGKK
ncbi:hypothetical protein PsorP6_016887 [Peronosclerospora sorghi]|uniref:Uncharacterized protein n=1 Tax=Peronosclerospora sorghi TaxID=230839 RepID=A0ACC0WCU2_9STRA|nr:hypothetical protein PsorP6_016887 [Peronosclerospora sorghi]